MFSYAKPAHAGKLVDGLSPKDIDPDHNITYMSPHTGADARPDERRVRAQTRASRRRGEQKRAPAPQLRMIRVAPDLDA